MKQYQVFIDHELLAEKCNDPSRVIADYVYDSYGENYEGEDWGCDSEVAWDEAKDYARDAVLKCLGKKGKCLTFHHDTFGSYKIKLK